MANGKWKMETFLLASSCTNCIFQVCAISNCFEYFSLWRCAPFERVSFSLLPWLIKTICNNVLLINCRRSLTGWPISKHFGRSVAKPLQVSPPPVTEHVLGASPPIDAFDLGRGIRLSKILLKIIVFHDVRTRNSSTANDFFMVLQSRLRQSIAKKNTGF